MRHKRIANPSNVLLVFLIVIGFSIYLVKVRPTQSASFTQSDRYIDDQIIIDGPIMSIQSLPRSRFLYSPLNPPLPVQQGWFYNFSPSTHEGVDYEADYGTPVYAAADGYAMTSVQSGDPQVYGTFVQIRHTNGYYTLYAHLSYVEPHIKVYPEDQRSNDNWYEWTPVSAGQLIGKVGNTGTWSYHLHFEVREDSYPSGRLDPYGLYTTIPYYPPATAIAPSSEYLWVANPPLPAREINKSYYTWWPNGWPYLVDAEDSRVFRFSIDDQQIWHDLASCAGKWILLDRGTHTVRYTYEVSGQSVPSLRIRPWPVLQKPVCAGEPSTIPPSEQPASSDLMEFIQDISLLPGSVVQPGSSLQRVWRVRNTGTTTWGSGYQLVFVSGNQMGAPGAVNIPAASPGQEVNLSVNMVAPSSTGTHTGYWRLRNPQGTFFGPTLFVKINVQTTSSYIKVLSTDPPSPADTSSVQIRVKVEGFPNLRATRLLIDGEEKYQIGAPEFIYPWDTSGYAVGDHSIVVEVADQTDTSWSRPERRAITYRLLGTGAAPNHAPYRPTPTSPYDCHFTCDNVPGLYTYDVPGVYGHNVPPIYAYDVPVN